MTDTIFFILFIGNWLYTIMLFVWCNRESRADYRHLQEQIDKLKRDGK